jgi:S1-C subfamily serine protease
MRGKFHNVSSIVLVVMLGGCGERYWENHSKTISATPSSDICRALQKPLLVKTFRDYYVREAQKRNLDCSGLADRVKVTHNRAPRHATHESGPKYVGEYREGKYHGLGTLTFPSGNQYVGNFLAGDFHGQGNYAFFGGAGYIGRFQHGTYSGQGAYTEANGDRYIGGFSDGKYHGQGTKTLADGRVIKGVWKNGQLATAEKTSPKFYAEQSPPPNTPGSTKPLPIPQTKLSTSGSGFFVSRLGHVVTNEHVVRGCKSFTVGDNANSRVRASLVGADKRNDLALLKLSSTSMASAETKSLIRKLGIRVIPLSYNGLLRSEDVELGESLLVAGYPYGEVFSDTIKVTTGIVSAILGIGDDSAQFQLDAAVQPGNSGGPIYDENGNIVGVVVAQLNKMKMAKTIGSMPENVNFGIKASTVRQFLTTAGLPTKWAARSKAISTKELAKIARSQTVMVACHR